MVFLEVILFFIAYLVGRQFDITCSLKLLQKQKNDVESERSQLGDAAVFAKGLDVICNQRDDDYDERRVVRQDDFLSWEEFCTFFIIIVIVRWY